MLVVLAGCVACDSKPKDIDVPDAWRPDAPGPGPADAAPPDSCPNIDASGGMPDLVPMGERTRDSLTRQEQGFQADDCAIVEGCVGGPGVRTLMRFSTVVYNQGPGDLSVGPPSDSDPAWEYSLCHGHYHLKGVAEYELLDGSGVVASGHKQSFCLVDTVRVDPAAGCASYTCDDQGIAAGWADIYAATLDCQWIDITGLPAGPYVLRVRVNPEQTLPESDYSNNVYEISVVLP